jgi:polygalacturonase
LEGTTIYGIDVQQDYLNGGPTGIPSNGVNVSDISFIDIVGVVNGSAQDVYILCGNGSCSDFTFRNILLGGSRVASSCNFPPSGCPRS